MEEFQFRSKVEKEKVFEVRHLLKLWNGVKYGEIEKNQLLLALRLF